MRKIIPAAVILLFASGAMGDIWTALFKEKLQEANSGNSEAQYDVGTMYQNGRGVKADRNKAIEWYQKAAAQGETKAISRLKLMSANANRFTRTSALAKQGDTEGLYDLGNMYTEGIGTNIDYARAIAAYEQSANQGHMKSAYKLGLIYFEGQGARRDGKQAYKWFRMAAEKDYPAAQYYVGKLHAEGIGVKRDMPQALVWFGKAVDGGFDQARGEMIAVSESLKAARVQAENASKAAEAKAEAAARQQAPAKENRYVKNNKSKAVSGSASQAKKPARKRYSVEDIVLAAWSRDDNPVAWLPSAITSCRTENSKVTCFSDDQVRDSGHGKIRYKTKAIISNFSSKGTFDITYRNLVVSAPKVAQNGSTEGTEEVGGTTAGHAQDYRVKTGWGNPHSMECRLKSRTTLECVKNGAHKIVLTTPAAIVAGN